MFRLCTYRVDDRAIAGPSSTEDNTIKGMPQVGFYPTITAFERLKLLKYEP
jgi:hypothetical protein